MRGRHYTSEQEKPGVFSVSFWVRPLWTCSLSQWPALPPPLRCSCGQRQHWAVTGTCREKPGLCGTRGDKPNPPLLLEHMEG
jgi:hypothetical protein